MAETVLTLVGILVVAAIAIALILKKLLYICGPNEVLIFSGSRRRLKDKTVGYVARKGGRKLKVPLFEKVDRMDLTNMVINVSVKGAFSKGGIMLNVDGVANVKIGGDEPLLSNAVERLLGKPRHLVISIAKETLEGNLRGVLATMTPEEVNSDKIRFAKALMDEADQDLNRLGIELDTLKIQNVSDGDGYLDAIGRVSGALVRKSAKIAEAENRAASVIKDASNRERAQVNEIEMMIRTLAAQTEREIADAQTKEAALVADSEGKVRASIAEAEAQLDVERARIERTKTQLEADVIAPAYAKMQAAINNAKGSAAKIVEEGRATAEVLTQITKAWKHAGPNARDVFLMQKLHTLIDIITTTMNDVKVDKITVLGAGTAANGNDLAQKVIGTNEQIKAALGVDLVEAISEKLAPALPRQAKDTEVHQTIAPPPHPQR